jgi:hypothetical protein
MKLISPQQAEAAAATRKAQQDEHEASTIKLAALKQLDTTGQEFATELEQAIAVVSKPAMPPRAALSLVSVLLGTTDLIRAAIHSLQNGGSPEVTRETTTVRRRTTPVVRAVAADTGQKRGRGRPPGSKNKTTLEREAKERAAAKAAKALNAAIEKKQAARKVVKKVKAKAMKRPAIKGGRKKR